MTEFTFSNGINEVMFDVDNDGKVNDIYTYTGEPIEIYSEGKDDFVSVTDKWEVGQNSLFIHCPKKMVGLNVKRLIEGAELLICSADREGNEELIGKMEVRYGLDTRF